MVPSRDRFWALLNRECLPALEAVRGNCPTREEFRRLSSPFHLRVNITKHQSTLRILTATLPYIDWNHSTIARRGYRHGRRWSVSNAAVPAMVGFTYWYSSSCRQLQAKFTAPCSLGGGIRAHLGRRQWAAMDYFGPRCLLERFAVETSHCDGLRPLASLDWDAGMIVCR
eukprot:COSAG02_NODE_541_length_20598_cov_278.953754_16_plen_170_part_00